jgi:hypothetical protein
MGQRLACETQGKCCASHCHLLWSGKRHQTSYNCMAQRAMLHLPWRCCQCELIVVSLSSWIDMKARQGINHTLDDSRPYEHPVILSVLEQAFFSGPSSIGAQLPNKFKSSRADRPNEKEIPTPMLALVSTGVRFSAFICVTHSDQTPITSQVYAAVKEREGGAHVAASFDSSIFETTYCRHVGFLQELLKSAPNKYHALMHRLSLRVS